jgi:sugar phosphate isomerase/epimerase
MAITRRDFQKLLFGGASAAIGIGTATYSLHGAEAAEYAVISGIPFGVEGFSFHDLPRGVPEYLIPKLIEYTKACGLTEIEPMADQIEPFGDNPTMKNFRSRDEVRQWRLRTPLSYYEGIRRQFESNGVYVYYYDITPNESFTDAEIDRVFEAAKALGAKGIGTSSKLNQARRLVPFAQRHKLAVIFHNHDGICDPNELATPQSLERVLDMSELFSINLDLGHYASGNNDTVEWVAKHPSRTAFLHIRDRKRNHGRYVPCGQGDAKISEVLRLIRDNKYPIRCYIEYEYGAYRTPIEEVRNSLQYCKDALGKG